MNAQSVPELIASLPYTTGYALSDRHVAVFLVDSTGRLDHSGVVDRTTDPVAVPALVDHAKAHQDMTAIFVTYGEAGLEVGTDLHRQTTDHDTLIFNVTDDRLRMTLSDGQWSESQTLPAPPVDAVMSSHAPAPSRAALGERFEPLPTSAYEPGPPMDHLMPSERAGWATRTLDALSQPGVEDTPAKQAIVAEAMLSNKSVRDAVLLHPRSPEQVEALVQVYRGAPPAAREDLAAAAAMTMYIRGWPRVGVETAVANAGHNNLAYLVNLGIQNHLNPQPLVADLEREAPRTLAKADTAWEERGATTRAAASFPKHPRTKGPTTPPTAARPTRAESGLRPPER